VAIQKEKVLIVGQIPTKLFANVALQLFRTHYLERL